MDTASWADLHFGRYGPEGRLCSDKVPSRVDHGSVAHGAGFAGGDVFRTVFIAFVVRFKMLGIMSGWCSSWIKLWRAPGFRQSLVQCASTEEYSQFLFPGKWLHGYVYVYSAFLGVSVVHAHASVYGLGGFPRFSTWKSTSPTSFGSLVSFSWRLWQVAVLSPSNVSPRSCGWVYMAAYSVGWCPPPVANCASCCADAASWASTAPPAQRRHHARISLWSWSLYAETAMWARIALSLVVDAHVLIAGWHFVSAVMTFSFSDLQGAPVGVYGETHASYTRVRTTTTTHPQPPPTTSTPTHALLHLLFS